MNDKEFSELRLRAAIVPEQSTWAAPEFQHWIGLHKAADVAREFARQGFARMDAIDKDADYTPQGKRRLR